MNSLTGCGGFWPGETFPSVFRMKSTETSSESPRARCQRSLSLPHRRTGRGHCEPALQGSDKERWHRARGLSLEVSVDFMRNTLGKVSPGQNPPHPVNEFIRHGLDDEPSVLFQKRDAGPFIDLKFPANVDGDNDLTFGLDGG